MKRNNQELARVYIEIIRKLSRMSDGEMRNLAAYAGVSYACLKNWKYGPTVAPRIDTLCKVAKEFGYEIKMVNKKTKLRIVA